MDSSSSDSSSGAVVPLERAMPAMPESGEGGCGALFDVSAGGCEGAACDTCGEGATEGALELGCVAGFTGASAALTGSSLGAGFGGGSTAFPACGSSSAGCAFTAAGLVCSLVLCAPGGGGSGDIPTPLLSLAAAAAAALAYFSGCPVGIVGNGAGFISDTTGFPTTLAGKVECSVESAGKGLLACC